MQVIWLISICLAIPQVTYTFYGDTKKLGNFPFTSHIIYYSRYIATFTTNDNGPIQHNQTLFTLHLDDTYMLCVPKLDYNHLFVVSTFLIFVIPMSIITILYILIGLQLRRSKIVHRASPSCNNVRLKVSFTNLSPESDINFYIKNEIFECRINNLTSFATSWHTHQMSQVTRKAKNTKAFFHLSHKLIY